MSSLGSLGCKISEQLLIKSQAQPPSSYSLIFAPSVSLLLYPLHPFCLTLGFTVTINRTARALAQLPALYLFFSVVALHVQAQVVPDMFDCGPLQKHRFRCDPPLTRNIQANPGQLTPTDIHDTSSIQGDEIRESPSKIESSSADGQEEEIINSNTSGAAHDHVGDGVEVVATLLPAVPPTSEGPECGPLEKHRFRCNPPLTQIRDINALG